MADDDAVQLNAQVDVELTAYGSLDLTEEWVTYLADAAEIPGTVDGVDPSISYADDGGTAYA
jgi:hypothetical protein